MIVLLNLSTSVKVNEVMLVLQMLRNDIIADGIFPALRRVITVDLSANKLHYTDFSHRSSQDVILYEWASCRLFSCQLVA